MLCEIEHVYSETLKPQDKEWDEVSKREAWVTDVKGTLRIPMLGKLMLTLNEGMSLPTSLI